MELKTVREFAGETKQPESELQRNCELARSGRDLNSPREQLSMEQADERLRSRLDRQSPQEVGEIPNLDMDEQMRRLSEVLNSCKELQPEIWERLSPAERLEVLQQIENAAAKIAGRGAYAVIPVQLAPNHYGQMVYREGKIQINESFLYSSDPEVMKQALDTVLHEGRHVYQWRNVFQIRTEPDDNLYYAWVGNLCVGAGYFTAQRYGFHLYAAQAVEQDARKFAAGVLSGIKL